jgi:hypothetical protein
MVHGGLIHEDAASWDACLIGVISTHARANVVRPLNPQLRKDAPKTGTAASCQGRTLALQKNRGIQFRYL